MGNELQNFQQTFSYVSIGKGSPSESRPDYYKYACTHGQ